MHKTDTTTTPGAATLTEAELFRRYLDAPIRVGATNSTLVDDPGLMERTTARDKFEYDTSYLELFEPMMSELPDNLLSFVEGEPDPIYLMGTCIDALKVMTVALTALKNDFERLADLTRLEAPNEGDEAASRHWKNARFVLQVSGHDEAA